MHVLFVVDPVAELNPSTDSSLSMMREGLRLGHRISICTTDRLSLRADQAWTRACDIEFRPDGSASEAGPIRIVALTEFNAVLMRKDPPFDQAFLTATWILDHARAPVFNAPAGLRELNEKLAILAFPDLIPATRIVREPEDLQLALDAFGGAMIVKPVFGFGGREVLHARADDPNLSTILELATSDGTRWTVAQAYVEAARQGDKRILLVDGEPIGAILRVPKTGALRNNFHAGGTAAATTLDSADLRICAALGPFLRAHGQFLVGIDVIGGLLTEINVTSPTGMVEIDRMHHLVDGHTMAARFWDGLSKRLTRT